MISRNFNDGVLNLRDERSRKERATYKEFARHIAHIYFQVRIQNTRLFALCNKKFVNFKLCKIIESSKDEDRIEIAGKAAALARGAIFPTGPCPGPP